MSLVRVLRTAAVALTHVFYVDETPTSASTGVTVAVTRLDGTAVSSGSATLGTPGSYTYTVPGQANLDTLVVDWTATSIGGAVVTARDYIEVAGGYLFGIAEARTQPPGLDATRFPTATLVVKRLEVEQECERICGRAFVPRFNRITLSGNDSSKLLLPHVDIRAVRAVKVNGTALAGSDLATVYPLPSGVLDRGYSYWPSGWNNVVVEYEHGMDYPPADLAQAAMLRLRRRLIATSSGVPDDAISWSAAEGGTYRLSTPTREKTGMPEVDATYARWTLDPGGFA